MLRCHERKSCHDDEKEEKEKLHTKLDNKPKALDKAVAEN